MYILASLIFLGLFFWLANLKLLTLSRDWPAILIFLGILSCLRATRRSRKRKIIVDLETGKITPDEAEVKLKLL